MKKRYFLVISVVFCCVACKYERIVTEPKVIDARVISSTRSKQNFIIGTPVVEGVSNAVVEVSPRSASFFVIVPKGTDVTNLKFIVDTISGASIAPNPSQSHDYSSPVTFKITTADGFVKSYTFQVQIAEN